MVREVVEEDVFVVVVLRPHADRDEEATKRNIFFVFLFFFVLCVLFTVDSAFFFVASFSQNPLAFVCFVTEKTRVASKTREREREKANLSRLSLFTHTKHFFFSLFGWVIITHHHRHNRARAATLNNTLLLIIITATTTTTS